MKVTGCIRLVRGELARNDREVALGRLQHTAGVLQQRRGVVTWRLERARKRLAVLAALAQNEAAQAR